VCVWHCAGGEEKASERERVAFLSQKFEASIATACMKSGASRVCVREGEGETGCVCV